MPLTGRGRKTLWIYTGVFLFMGLLVITVPVDAMPLLVCLPALFSAFSDRIGKPTAALAAALAPALLAFVPGFAGSAIVYLFVIGLGVLFHRLLGRGSVNLAVLVPSSLVLAFAFTSTLYLAAGQGVTIGALISQWVGGFFDQLMAVYRQTASEGVIREMTAFRERMEGYAVKLFWGFLASSVLSVMWVNLLIANGVNRRYPLGRWRCPDWVVGLFILSGVLSLVSYGKVSAVGLNLLIVVLQVYFFQGMAIASSFMAHHEWSRFIRTIVYVLILTQIYIMIGIAGLGLFDTWFDFRKKIRSSEGDKT